MAARKLAAAVIAAAAALHGGADAAGLMGLHGRSTGDGPSLHDYRERLVRARGGHGAQALDRMQGSADGPEVAPLPPQWPQCSIPAPPAPPAPSVQPNAPALTEQVRMRDGTLLNTIVYFPLLAKHAPKTPVGTVLYRTPYNASSLALAYNVSTEVEPFVVDPGMAVVLQDVRGCGPKSVPGQSLSPCELPGHGKFTFPNTSWHDGYDTVEWITKQPWSNGKVVLDGPSALAVCADEKENATPRARALFLPLECCVCPEPVLANHSFSKRMRFTERAVIAGRFVRAADAQPTPGDQIILP